MESLALTTYLNFSGILLGLRKNKNVIHEKEVCIEGTVFFTSKTKQVFFSSQRILKLYVIHPRTSLFITLQYRNVFFLSFHERGTNNFSESPRENKPEGLDPWSVLGTFKR